ncbi:bacteriocin [Halomonas sp. BN3-1]|uniref:bacteriocin n=1 Tax=Halomonas sp. BN3-1 TaxID=2082393 RepID=UPI000D3DB4B9|nr:bacteriocin [Halomonas sp. BN3-1]
MSYGLLGLRGQLEGEAMQGLQDISNQQRQAAALEDQQEQAKKTQTMSATATGAAVGATYGGPWGALIGAGVGYLSGELM